MSDSEKNEFGERKGRGKRPQSGRSVDFIKGQSGRGRREIGGVGKEGYLGSVKI